MDDIKVGEDGKELSANTAGSCPGPEPGATTSADSDMEDNNTGVTGIVAEETTGQTTDTAVEGDKVAEVGEPKPGQMADLAVEGNKIAEGGAQKPGDTADMAVEENKAAEGGEPKPGASEDSGESSPESSPEEMTGKERNLLFEKAESYFSKSKLDLALQSYLRCVKGIERGSGFLYLPQCLHQIAECYHLKEEDEKAIQFLKAEKIYYETALIDTKQMQEKIEEIAGGDDPVSDGLESEILRAVEYENLAKLCLEKHQSQLALEFSGKATKVYQKHYGDEHPSTQRCLDLFTTIYAEVGKEEYTSKLSEYTDSPAEPSTAPADDSQDVQTMRRRRKPQATSQETLGSEGDPGQSGQPEPESTEPYHEPSCCCSFTFLWIVFVVCSILTVFLFSVVYCRVTPTSSTCRSIRINYRALSEYLGFLQYRLVKG